MYSQPHLLQGVYSFHGRGLQRPQLLHEELSWTVPASQQAQLVYFRAGNSAEEMIDLIVMRDGRPMRHFPIGARGDCHITLAVVEDLAPGTALEVFVAAPEDVTGTVVLDVGLVAMEEAGVLAY